METLDEERAGFPRGSDRVAGSREDVAGALAGLRGRFPDVEESDVAAGGASPRAVVAHPTGSVHRQTRDVRFSAPCALNSGTVAVPRYQWMLPARTEGR